MAEKPIREPFEGEQLRMARELRRLTQAALATRTQEIDPIAGVSGAAISQYEHGEAVPSEETLDLLVTALNVDRDFLAYRGTDAEADIPAFFRSLRSTPAVERKRARSLVQMVHRLAGALAEGVGLPEVDLPKVRCDPFEAEPRRREAAENAAEQVRDAWSLGTDPVPSVAGSIESHGVVCIRLRFDEERIDAFSVPFSDRPVLVLSTDKEKWDRSRFDAAHELGHIVMHSEMAGAAEAERQANEFAAGFLMPRRGIKSELPSRPDWRRLLQLKDKWGCSMASLLYRARTLKVMPEQTYVNATKVMAARGWRRHEPLNRRPEDPTLLRTALHRAQQTGVDFDQLRHAAVIPLDLFEEIISDLLPVTDMKLRSRPRLEFDSGNETI